MQRMVSLWIALTLLAAPVPALSIAPATAGGDHCLSGQQHTGHSQAISHHQHAETKDNAHDCTHCGDRVCEHGDCTGQNCSSFHSPTTLTVIIGSRFYATADIFSPSSIPWLLSRTFPPPLRPPA